MTDPRPKAPLGKILLRRKAVSPEALDRALEAQKLDRRPLASALVEDGVVSEGDALRALSEQYGVPGIDLAQVAISAEDLGLVPREVAEAQRILPVLVRDDKLFLAMGDPTDRRVIDELEFVTGRRVFPYVAVSGALARTIAAAYDAKDAGDSHYLGPDVPKSTLERLGLDVPPERPTAPAPSGPPEDAHPIDEMGRPSDRPTPVVAAPKMPSERPSQVDSPAAVIYEQVERGVMKQTGDFGEVREELSRVAQLPVEPVRPTGPNQKLILVVDDENEIRALVKRLLEGQGHKVLEADRGLLALHLVKEHTPDIIVLDAMLPEVHGFDIARRIKTSERYKDIPIIMISAMHKGWRIAKDMKEAYGIEEYLEKPFKMQDLLAAIGRAITQSQTGARDPDAISAEARSMLDKSVEIYQKGDVEGAIALLKQGIRLDPLAYRLRYHLGLLYFKHGQLYDGISELEQAVELNPSSYPALRNLAILYERAGFKNKAVEMWERCAQVAPDDKTRDQIRAHILDFL